MRVAITGVSGFIGAELARQAAEAGHEVTALVRPTSRREHVEACVDRFVVGSQEDPRVMSELLEGAEAVIHNSFDWKFLKEGDLDGHLESNLIGAIRFLEASGDRHFIHMSSISVHSHMHPRWEGSIDESHPTRPGGTYGACKAAIEAHLWAVHAMREQPFTAIRPCGVYGIDPNRERSIGWPIIEQVRRQEPYTRKGGGKFVHVEDVAAATIACLGNEKSSPCVYDLVDCYARWADWALITADLLGVEIAIDTSSPEQPLNTFEKDTVQQDLGVSMNRGFDGIREHLARLIQLQSGS